MKRLLLASALLAFGSVGAMADSITLTATCDGSLCAALASANGTLDVSDQAFGPVFNLNSLSINTAEFLAPPTVLSTNTLDVDQTAGGSHTLVIDIVGHNITGPNFSSNILSSFSVSGQTAGWSIQEQTLINGVVQVTSPVFTGVSTSGSATTLAFLGTTFDAEAIYTITSDGVGSVNGGIDI